MKFQQKLESLSREEIAKLDEKIHDKIYRLLEQRDRVKQMHHPLMKYPKQYDEFRTLRKRIEHCKSWTIDEVGEFVDTLLRQRKRKKTKSQKP
jgi:hypothetical protein